MRVISFINQKGGVAKTTSAVATYSILRDCGQKVLLIDCDKQCNSTDTMRGEFEGVGTIYDVLLDENRVSIKDCIQNTEFGDIVAGDPLLRLGDNILKPIEGSEFYLVNALKEVEELYDYVIIDTNPAIDSIMHNVLTASTDVIIPMKADKYSLMGFEAVIEAIIQIKQHFNPHLKVTGILITQYNKNTNFQRAVSDELENICKQLDTKVFKSKIRATVKVMESQGEQMPLPVYSNNCTASTDYLFFIKELLES